MVGAFEGKLKSGAIVHTTPPLRGDTHQGVEEEGQGWVLENLAHTPAKWQHAGG